MKLKIGTVLTIIVLLFGAYFYIDAEYANAQEFKGFQQRAERRWAEDEWSSIRKRLWELEKYYGIIEAQSLPEHHELVLEKERLERELKGR